MEPSGQLPKVREIIHLSMCNVFQLRSIAPISQCIPETSAAQLQFDVDWALEVVRHTVASAKPQYRAQFDSLQFWHAAHVRNAKPLGVPGKYDQYVPDCCGQIILDRVLQCIAEADNDDQVAQYARQLLSILSAEYPDSEYQVRFMRDIENSIGKSIDAVSLGSNMCDIYTELVRCMRMQMSGATVTRVPEAIWRVLRVFVHQEAPEALILWLLHRPVDDRPAVGKETYKTLLGRMMELTPTPHLLPPNWFSPANCNPYRLFSGLLRQHPIDLTRWLADSLKPPATDELLFGIADVLMQLSVRLTEDIGCVQQIRPELLRRLCIAIDDNIESVDFVFEYLETTGKPRIVQIVKNTIVLAFAHSAIVRSYSTSWRLWQWTESFASPDHQPDSIMRLMMSSLRHDPHRIVLRFFSYTARFLLQSTNLLAEGLRMEVLSEQPVPLPLPPPPIGQWLCMHLMPSSLFRNLCVYLLYIRSYADPLPGEEAPKLWPMVQLALSLVADDPRVPHCHNRLALIEPLLLLVPRNPSFYDQQSPITVWYTYFDEFPHRQLIIPTLIRACNLYAMQPVLGHACKMWLHDIISYLANYPEHRRLLRRIDRKPRSGVPEYRRFVATVVDDIGVLCDQLDEIVDPMAFQVYLLYIASAMRMLSVSVLFTPRIFDEPQILTAVAPMLYCVVHYLVAFGREQVVGHPVLAAIAKLADRVFGAMATRAAFMAHLRWAKVEMARLLQHIRDGEGKLNANHTLPHLELIGVMFTRYFSINTKNIKRIDI